MKFVYTYSGKSDIGLVRQNNDDSYDYADCAETGRGVFWAVADGMAGYAGGGIASRRVLDDFGQMFKVVMGRNQQEWIERAVTFSNENLLQYAQLHPELSDMGTTLSLLSLMENKACICNIGDSRIYLIRNGTITQLSDDNTVVNELLKQGLISEDEVENHPKKHALTHVIGREFICDNRFIANFISEPGDVFVLCTDGLTNHVCNSEILAMASTYTSEEACTKLVELAKQRGGSDNITIQIISVTVSENEITIDAAEY